MSADSELQVAIRAWMLAKASLIALVPAASILDTHARPFPSPSIILGESQEIDPRADYGRKRWTIIHTLHVWKEEPSLMGVKAIMGEIMDAMHLTDLAMTGEFRCSDIRVAAVRTLRDPDGKTSHGVLTLEAQLWRVAS